MDARDLMAGVIDEDVAMRNLQRFLKSGDDVPRILEAPAVLRFECGHVRPINRWFSPGDEFFCLLCGRQRVTALELLPVPVEFPAPDSLFDLPVASVAEDSQATKGWSS